MNNKNLSGNDPIPQPLIDPRAAIHPSAKIAEGVTIGPFSFIGENVEIGSGTWIGPHAVVRGRTKIGVHNKIYQFASVGEDPQDKKYQGEDTWLEIGDYNVIRECCTINRGTAQDKGITKIGDHNLLMAYVHIAHDCTIGNQTIFANNATLAGHVTVDDYVILGGFSAIYQFCHLGIHSFIASGALVEKDVLPFTRVSGAFAKPFGLNVEGLKRRGFSPAFRSYLKQAYRIAYRQGYTAEEAVTHLEPLVAECPEIQLFIDILKTAKHGICR